MTDSKSAGPGKGTPRLIIKKKPAQDAAPAPDTDQAPKKRASTRKIPPQPKVQAKPSRRKKSKEEQALEKVIESLQKKGMERLSQRKAVLKSLGNREFTDEQRHLIKQCKSQQIAFVNWIRQGLPATRAYIEAYYGGGEAHNDPRIVNIAARSASELVRNPKIEALIQMLKETDILAAEYGRDWIKATLVEVVERCLELKPVLFFGEPVEGLVQFDPQSIIKAVAEINKMDGNHAPTQVKASGTIDHVHRAGDQVSQRIEELLAPGEVRH